MAEDKEFTIRDRRGGSPEAGADAAQTPREQPRQDAGSGPGITAEQPSEAAPHGEMDFATFVISLASTAQMSLGAIPHPETNKAETNLPAAKQMIDILALMQEKTKGNLTKDEGALLEQVLFNLRMHYVRVAEGQKKSGG